MGVRESERERWDPLLVWRQLYSTASITAACCCGSEVCAAAGGLLRARSAGGTIRHDALASRGPTDLTVAASGNLHESSGRMPDVHDEQITIQFPSLNLLG